MTIPHDRTFYDRHGFDRLSGDGAGAVAELDEHLAQLRGDISLKANVYDEAVRADFPAATCAMPINLLLWPERRMDWVLIRAGAGAAWPTHVHGYGDELYLVIAGEAQVTIGDTVHDAGPLDLFHVPAGTPHGFHLPEDYEGTFDLFAVNSPGVAHHLRSRYWASEPLPGPGAPDAG
ncbi:cupin domain-containing protein [Euzebya tangerina]|uniref:cupin domain-containing protein n=1 Tax=Euzebya tangerina TaxID=591198 RepID=UPI000E323804|nr:cupin domain-containing protein [Euzebya tangerina]